MIKWYWDFNKTLWASKAYRRATVVSYVIGIASIIVLEKDRRKSL